MSEFQLTDMNSSMLEIWQDYLEVISIFNSKLEEIHADEIINANLSLLKASIIDLQINISNFKDSLGIVNSTDNKTSRTISNTEEYNIGSSANSIESASASSSANCNANSNDHINTNSNTNTKDMPKIKLSKEDLERMMALFFMYIMKIDNESILNNNVFCSSNPGSGSGASLGSNSSSINRSNTTNTANSTNTQSVCNKPITPYPIPGIDDVELD
jgi:hypothetical protein